jgi:hypothetical protein
VARVAASKTLVVSKKGTSPRRGVPSAGTLVLGKATPRQRKMVPVTREYVGIDLHRHRSVIIRKNAEGEFLSKVLATLARLLSRPRSWGRDVGARPNTHKLELQPWYSPARAESWMGQAER